MHRHGTPGRFHLAAALVLLALAVPTQGRAQQIGVADFLAKMRSLIVERQNRIETSSILNGMPMTKESYLVEGDSRTRCFFDFGDAHKFVDLALGGLGGVVVDPGYLDDSGHADTLAIYQNVNTLTLTFSRYEAKYNGFIVLRRFDPAPGNDAQDDTQLHETIHALAYGIKRLDLDEDGPGADAPEYISKTFFEEQHRLQKREETALREVQKIQQGMVQALNGLDADKDEAKIMAIVKRNLAEIVKVAEAYLDAVTRLRKVADSGDHSWDKVRDLMAHWGGKADWDGLVRATQENIKTLSAFAAAVGSDKGGSEMSDRFNSFYFKKRCIP